MKQNYREILAQFFNTVNLKKIFFIYINNIFSFQGRANRKEYLFAILINRIVSYSFMTLFFRTVISPVTSKVDIDKIKDYAELNQLFNNNYSFYIGFLFLAIFIILLNDLAFKIRRLHDVGFSGGWSIITFIAYITFPLRIVYSFTILSYLIDYIIEIPYVFIRGTKGKNKYGDPPEF